MSRQPVLMAKKVGKDGKGGKWSCTLYGHLQQCKDVAEWLANARGVELCNMVGITDAEQIQWFRDALTLAAVLHDFGKATNAFQEMLSKGRAPHWVRHEAISVAMILESDEIRQLLLETVGARDVGDWRAALLLNAILGHHLKSPANRHRSPNSDRFGQEPIRVLWNASVNDQLIRLLRSEQEAALRVPSSDTCLDYVGDWGAFEVRIRDPIADTLAAIKRDKSCERRALGSLLRGTLIAVDTLGSLGCDSQSQWEDLLSQIRSCFDDEGLPQVIGGLVTQVRSQAGRVEIPEITEFQERVAVEAADIVIATAGCGSGKTLAAYRWAQQRSARSLFFAFPTTATASQSFSDYADPLGEAVIQLLHSRSDIDVELMTSAGQEDGESGSSPEEAIEQASLSEVMSHLLYPATACTVDVVLGIMRNYRPSLCLLPRMANACFVFDEVHAYEESLFQHFLEFLKEIKAPILVMTASFTPTQRSAIERIEGKTKAFVEGPQEHESLLRYRMSSSVTVPLRSWSGSDIWRYVVPGRKILVVANTVSRASAWFHEMLQSGCDDEVTVILLHSHFKYVDRVTRQKALTDAFRNPTQTVVAVTTQICEISFDISADLLISDVAPLPSLVQRMGRLNRHASLGELCGDVVLVDVDESKPQPYKAVDIRLGRDVAISLAKLPSFSQASLREALDEMEPESVRHAATLLAWFDLQKSHRGDSPRSGNYNVDVLLQSDYLRYQDSSERRKRILPLSAGGLNIRNQKLKWRHCFVVPDEMVQYDAGKSGTGGRWKADEG